MIGEVLAHVMTMEGAVVGSTMGLAYVTAYPYAVRQRHRDRVVRTVRVIYVVCCYHGKWVVWQVVARFPGRLPRDKG